MRKQIYIDTWNLKHPFINGCFNWMMMNQLIPTEKPPFLSSFFLDKEAYDRLGCSSTCHGWTCTSGNRLWRHLKLLFWFGQPQPVRWGLLDFMLLDLLFWFHKDTKFSISWAPRCFCSEVSCPIFPQIFHTFDFQYLVWRFFLPTKKQADDIDYWPIGFRTSKNMIFGELLRWTSSIPRCQQKQKICLWGAVVLCCEADNVERAKKKGKKSEKPEKDKSEAKAGTHWSGRCCFK